MLNTPSTRWLKPLFLRLFPQVYGLMNINITTIEEGDGSNECIFSDRRLNNLLGTVSG